MKYINIGTSTDITTPPLLICTFIKKFPHFQLLVSSSCCHILTTWTQSTKKHSFLMSMNCKFSFPFHIPDDDLIQRKTLTTKYLWWINWSNDSTNLRSRIKWLNNSFSIFPELYFTISISPSRDKHIWNWPIKSFNSSLMLILTQNVITFTYIIDINAVVITPRSKIGARSFDSTNLLKMS